MIFRNLHIGKLEATLDFNQAQGLYGTRRTERRAFHHGRRAQRTPRLSPPGERGGFSDHDERRFHVTGCQPARVTVSQGLPSLVRA